MAVFVALLRAVNVGGTGKLPMSDLVRICEAAGFRNPKTYIASGNVVFESALAEDKVKAKLEKALAVKLGKPCGVMVRTAAELDAVLTRNPFQRAEPNRVLVLFLDTPPAKESLAGLKIPGREEVRLAGREIFIHYPDGMGTSKLNVPMAKAGTGRNLNTVARLAVMAHATEGS